MDETNNEFSLIIKDASDIKTRCFNQNQWFQQIVGVLELVRALQPCTKSRSFLTIVTILRGTHLLFIEVQNEMFKFELDSLDSDIALLVVQCTLDSVTGTLKTPLFSVPT